ncbi:MAG: hypothetical protein HYZ75_03115 [Elusimicrobia bacterium]|nr:hypothetical protein [Elusimicrobiota bacterium]
MLNTAVPLARKHLREPRLYSIQRAVDSSLQAMISDDKEFRWEFVFSDAESEKYLHFIHSKARPVEYFVLTKNPKAFGNALIHRAPSSGGPFYDVVKWSFDPAAKSWSKKTGDVVTMGRSPCGLINVKFVDSLDVESLLARIGAPMCDPAQPERSKVQVSLFHPVPSDSPGAICRGQSLFGFADDVWENYRLAPAPGNLWGIYADKTVTFLDAASGKVLYRGPTK